MLLAILDETHSEPGLGSTDDLAAPSAASALPSGAPLLPSMRYNRPVIIVQFVPDAKVIERIQKKVDLLIGKGKRDFILDLEEVVAVSGACVQAFHHIHLQAQAAGGQMVVRHAPNHAIEEFRKAGLIGILFFEYAPIRRPDPREA